MAERPQLKPGPGHPITVSENPLHIVVTVGGKKVADTKRALSLKEATYPAVNYIPREDVDMSLLERTDHETYCPYKGACHYFSIPTLGARGSNAVWTYESPYPDVAEIKDHLAFYPDRVEITAS